MYAVIETGGKQYKVSNGDTIYVEKLDAAEESTVDFKVVAVSTDDGFKVGTPYVEGAKVSGKVLKMVRARRLLSLLISLRRAKNAKWATDSLTQRYKSKLSKHND